MWSEEMDNKIRAASENNVHSYEERNWKDMEILLEKHLPEQKRRRRIIFLILVPVLAVSGILLTRQFSADKHPAEQTISQQKNINPASPDTKEQDRSAADLTTPDKRNNNSEKIIAPATGSQSDEIKTTTILSTDRIPFNNKNAHTVAVNQSPKVGILKRKQSFVPNESGTANAESQTVSKTNDPASVKSNTTNPETNSPAPDLSQTGNPQKLSPATTVDSSISSSSTVADSKKEPTDSSIAAIVPPVKKEQSRKQKGSKISINFSAGPDYASVRFSHPGGVRMQYGIGIGYAVSEKLTIRTGLYAGHKIYSADSNDYHIPPAGVYSYRLYDVNANCFVYEIPVSLMYNFNQSKNHNWFVSAGLSSYIMKKEDYEYNYKNPWGQTMTHQYNYNNKNAHFFSVIGLSGGYQYHFNKRFSLLAEPYLKMPFTGIGAGKVRLNSTGVLFTLSMKPFAR